MVHLEARLCDYGMGSRIPALPEKSLSEKFSRDESPLASPPLERREGVVSGSKETGGGGGGSHTGGEMGGGEGAGDVFEVADADSVGGVQELVFPHSSTNAGLDIVDSAATADSILGSNRFSRPSSPPIVSVIEWPLQGASSLTVPAAEQNTSPTSTQEESDEIHSTGNNLKSPLSPKLVVKRKCSPGSAPSWGGATNVTADRVVRFDVDVLKARMEHLRVSSGDLCTLPNEQLGGVSEGGRDGESQQQPEASNEGTREEEEGGKVRFLAKIVPRSNSAAEDELRREIR